MPPEGVAQITDGLVDLTTACSSEIVLGPGDFALYVDTSETHVLSGVATIDTTLIESVRARAAHYRGEAKRVKPP